MNSHNDNCQPRYVSGYGPVCDCNHEPVTDEAIRQWVKEVNR